MSSDPLYDQFARMLARPGGGPGRAPRALPPLALIGRVASADPFQSTLSFDYGGGLVIPEVAYIQQYSSTELPRPNDSVVMTVVAGAAPFISGKFVTAGHLGGTVS